MGVMQYRLAGSINCIGASLPFWALEVPQALGESLDSWREDLAENLASAFPDGIRVVLTAEQKPQASLPPASSAPHTTQSACQP